MRIVTLMIALSILSAAAVRAAEEAPVWNFKAEFRPRLLDTISGILKTRNPKTGRFGSGVWIVTDQNVLFPLAVAWSLPGEDNPWYHNADLLDAIMDGGDALIRDQDKTGKWVFRKKDKSTWGDIYMPWTYSRWVRAYAIIKDAMPESRRKRWEKALLLGYDGISKTALNGVQNIPAHHAMGLYCAGQIFDRPEWCTQAREFLRKVAKAQYPSGYWTEHSGPVVMYNTVYVDALGAYYAMSKDKAVRPALERSARFHAALTYPDGSMVETVDERNPYHDTISMPNHGFSFSPVGRGFIRRQWELKLAEKGTMSADGAAAFILYGEEGPSAPTLSEQDRCWSVIGESEAATLREKPWFACASAYTAPLIASRWIQDRQNFVSLYHDKTGLILGGGNTKMQPLWSTFTVGDVSLLQHKQGDENPNFIPPVGLLHVPSKAFLAPKSGDKGFGLNLDYGKTKCSVKLETVSPTQVSLTYSIAEAPAQAVAAHVTLLPHIGRKWETASGKSGVLGKEPVNLGPGEAGEWFGHAGWRISVPPNAAVSWPVLPHNPYTKDGHAETAEGRIVLTLPLDKDTLSRTVTVEVP